MIHTWNLMSLNFISLNFCACIIFGLQAGMYTGRFEGVQTNPLFQLEEENLVFTLFSNMAEHLHCIGENHEFVCAWLIAAYL